MQSEIYILFLQNLYSKETAAVGALGWFDCWTELAVWLLQYEQEFWVDWFMIEFVLWSRDQIVLFRRRRGDIQYKMTKWPLYNCWKPQNVIMEFEEIDGEKKAYCNNINMYWSTALSGTVPVQ